jgi:hypothetical protein
MGLILSLLLVLSSLIRGFSVSTLPPELFGDEIDVGYQAFSLLKTGRDLYGQPFPLLLHSLAEWRTPLLIYYTVPAVFAFGNNEWGVRAPEVILGSLAPVILFLLVYRLSLNRSLSLLSSLTLVLMPWHILYSRAAFEAVLLLDFVLLGTLLFVRRRFALSAVFFALTLYIYNTAVVFTPLWLICLWLIFRPKIRISYLIFPLLLVPFIWLLFFGKAGERFGKVGLFGSPEITDSVIEARSTSVSPVEIIFANKPLYDLKKIFNNYLSAFSPEFLFIRGDPTARHSLQYIGQLLPVWVPFLVLGLVYLIKQRAKIWLVWLIIAPVPAALTIDGAYHATRLFMMIPSLAVAIGAGIYWLIITLKGKIKVMAYFLIWVVISFQFADTADYYFFRYTKNTWRWWHVGFKSAMTELVRLAPGYQQIFINNTYEPSLIRFLFYASYPPRQFQDNFITDKPRADISPGYYGFFLLPKYLFGTFTPPANKSLIDVMQPGNLYLVSQRDEVPGDADWRKDPPGGISVLYTSVNPFNQPIFYLVTRI